MFVEKKRPSRDIWNQKENLMKWLYRAKSIPLPNTMILSEIMRASIGMNLAYCNPVKKSSIFVTLSILLLGISHIRRLNPLACPSLILTLCLRYDRSLVVVSQYETSIGLYAIAFFLPVHLILSLETMLLFSIFLPEWGFPDLLSCKWRSIVKSQSSVKSSENPISLITSVRIKKRLPWDEFHISCVLA